jgi:hypothetical protein
MTTNDTEYENGLRMFEISFNRTRNVDTLMDMEVIKTTKEKFWELRWRSKLLYVLKSLRCDPCLGSSFLVLGFLSFGVQGIA